MWCQSPSEVAGTEVTAHAESRAGVHTHSQTHTDTHTHTRRVPAGRRTSSPCVRRRENGTCEGPEVRLDSASWGARPARQGQAGVPGGLRRGSWLMGTDKEEVGMGTRLRAPCPDPLYGWEHPFQLAVSLGCQWLMTAPLINAVGNHLDQEVRSPTPPTRGRHTDD